MAKKVGYKFFKYMCTQDTVWKIHDFLITQILCEIKFGDSRKAKSVIFIHLVALNSDLYMNFYRMAKKIVLEFLDCPKLISRKI